MRFISLIFVTLLAVAIGPAQPAQGIQDFDVKPALKEANGLAYVDANTRLGYIQRANLWQPMDLDQIDTRAGHHVEDSRGRSMILPNMPIVECNYVHEALGGTTNKFHCDNVKATDAAGNPIDARTKKIKVRYHSVKAFSDVITTRLAWALGFGAEIETPVARVLCHGCSKDPFHQHAPVQGDETFTPASVETHLPGHDGIYVAGTRYPKDEGEDNPGWYWSELKYIKDPQRAIQADALKLFAAFIKHGDSKAIQNRIMCLSELDNGICPDPFLYVNDFGNTLGSDGMSVHPLDLKKWSEAAVWKDNKSCEAKLHMNMGNGSGLSDPEISEAGRKFLADLLTNLIRHESKLRDIFEAGRIQEYDDHGQKHSADEWVKVFEARAAQIVNHPPCPR